MKFSVLLNPSCFINTFYRKLINFILCIHFCRKYILACWKIFHEKCKWISCLTIKLDMLIHKAWMLISNTFLFRKYIMDLEFEYIFFNLIFLSITKVLFSSEINVFNANLKIHIYWREFLYFFKSSLLKKEFRLSMDVSQTDFIKIFMLSLVKLSILDWKYAFLLLIKKYKFYLISRKILS